MVICMPKPPENLGRSPSKFTSGQDKKEEQEDGQEPKEGEEDDDGKEGRSDCVPDGPKFSQGVSMRCPLVWSLTLRIWTSLDLLLLKAILDLSSIPDKTKGQLKIPRHPKYPNEGYVGFLAQES